MSENIIVLGATSGIGQALCRVLARRGCQLILAGRSADKLKGLADELGGSDGPGMFTETFDALDPRSHPSLMARCFERFEGEVDGVILCFGYLPDSNKSREDPEELRRTIDTNFTAAGVILNLAAQHLETAGAGYIAAISSVAGDRGRQSNYAYGAAKAGLTVFLQGLRNRLAPHGVHVLTIVSGWVDTAMTKGLVNPNSKLVASPETVAIQIDRAIRRRRNLIYTPRFWRLIMAVVRMIPEGIFKHLRM